MSVKEEKKLNRISTNDLRIRNMTEKEKLFLLNDLNEIEKKVIEDCYLQKIPFVSIFKMHKKGYSATYISRELKINNFTVNSIIHGGITIPKSKIKKIEELGLTICYNCGKRIVPIKPLEHVILTRLCKICYKRGGEIEYSIPSDIKI